MRPQSVSELLDFEHLTSPDTRGFADLWLIYTASLPPREQKSRAQIAAAVRQPQYRMWLARQAGAVVAFSICFAPIEERFVLLEYMAVAEGHRSKGIGSRLLRYTISAAADQRPGVTMLVEVDSEREDSPDRRTRLRRKQFYRTADCRCIKGLAYILPLPGDGALPEMDLMVRQPDPRLVLAKADLEGWLERIYREVYACPANDPRIDQMLVSVSDPVELE